MSHTGNPRRALHAFLSDGAYQGLAGAADHTGVSISALVEALGRDFAAALPPQNIANGADWWAGIERAARNIDAERRRRRIVKDPGRHSC